MGTFDEQLARAVDAAGAEDDLVEYGIGPHAAYTVPLPVLTAAARGGP